jgi:antitoxin CptB
VGDTAAEDLARLRWHCRRGMKELDLLLAAYLEDRYASASSAEQQAFAKLLELQDPTLFAYLMGRERPTNEDARRVVDALRRAP